MGSRNVSAVVVSDSRSVHSVSAELAGEMNGSFSRDMRENECYIVGGSSSGYRPDASRPGISFHKSGELTIGMTGYLHDGRIGNHFTTDRDIEVPCTGKAYVLGMNGHPVSKIITATARTTKRDKRFMIDIPPL